MGWRMGKLAKLLKQQAELERQIKEVAKTERAEALKSAKELCKRHKFTASMLRGSLASGRVRNSNGEY